MKLLLMLLLIICTAGCVSLQSKPDKLTKSDLDVWGEGVYARQKELVENCES